MFNLFSPLRALTDLHVGLPGVDTEHHGQVGLAQRGDVRVGWQQLVLGHCYSIYDFPI